jgi:hypothetical protein
MAFDGVNFTLIDNIYWYPNHWLFQWMLFILTVAPVCHRWYRIKMHKPQWNTRFQAQVLVSFDKRSNILCVTWIIATKHHCAWSEHTSCPIGVQMVTSYFSIKHLTVSYVRATVAHTGPFHTLLNHPSSQLLTVTNLTVYCHTSVLAILSWSAWPLEMKALCFFEMSGANAPVTQHHSPEDLYFNYCSEHLRSYKHQLDNDADGSLSMTVLMSLVMQGEKYSEVTHCVYLLFLCSSLANLWQK